MVISLDFSACDCHFGTSIYFGCSGAATAAVYWLYHQLSDDVFDSICSAASDQVTKDRASVQLFSSLVLYPLTWGYGLRWLISRALEADVLLPLFPSISDVPVAATIFVGSISMISCIVMFVYLRALQRMFRAWKVRWTKEPNEDTFNHCWKNEVS